MRRVALRSILAIADTEASAPGRTRRFCSDGRRSNCGEDIGHGWHPTVVYIDALDFHRRGQLPMHTLDDLANEIDSASDAGDEAVLRRLGEDCESRLRTAENEDRVHLLYYWSNTYSSIIAIKQNNPDFVWNWKQPEGVQNILLLRRAIKEPSFDTIAPILARQIRTNLASRLHAIGRPVAANEERLRVLEYDPLFAKALAGQAKGIASYARQLYDQDHIPILLGAARALFDAALGKDAFWESGDRDSFASGLLEERTRIADELHRNHYDEDYNLNQWSLGDTKEERSYRRWCLRNRLFLNPLNEAYTETVAATDVLHLPSHSYGIKDVLRFPAYYNLLKQEYVSARYRLYRATHEDDPEFIMRDVLMLDSGEGQALGHYTEDLRSAFRSTYAIFDKIGLFLNDYFQIGHEPRNVSFQGVWFVIPRRDDSGICPMFKNHRNWPLRGLYFLSKDLFDQDFKEVSEPDAVHLAQLRNQLEHRFLSFQHFRTDRSTDTHQFIPIDEFENKTLRLLKMAREALIYLSLAMHREEQVRKEAISDDKTLGIAVISRPMKSFDRY